LIPFNQTQSSDRIVRVRNSLQDTDSLIRSDQISKKIAFFMPSLRGGGAERVMLELATEFSKAGMSVDLVLVKAEGPYLPLVPDTINVVDLAANRTLKALPALVAYLRRRRPHAILATIDHINMMTVWARFIACVPSRVVLRISNMAPERKTGRYGRLGMPILKFLKRMTFLYADRIIAVSAGVKGNLNERVSLPADTIDVIYNPVDGDKLQSLSREAIGHCWFDTGQVPVILAVGRLEKQKDYPTLLRAFAKVRVQQPCKLLILGEGSERNRLEAMIDDLGLKSDVSLPGFVSNPFPYMAKARVLVLSSTHEGMPNVLIQALALGTPVIATDCASGPDEILDGGRYGSLVAVGDSAAMAREMSHVVAAEIIDAERLALMERSRYFSTEKAIAAYRKALFPDPVV
jgi:glycosyltransferase involved in cell wall biosynthesis